MNQEHPQAPSPTLLRALLWLLALLPLLISAVWINPASLHLEGMWSVLNDQVVYIDAARNLLAQGKLEAGVLYPSTLLQDYGRNYMYMPGHAMTLAASFWLLGDSPLSAVLPSLLALALACLALWMLGRKLLGPQEGLHATWILLAVPPIVIYSLTAMSELTFLAAGLVALALFAHLPTRAQALAAPALLLLPFFFRETGALWIIPMVALSLRDEQGSLSMKGLPRAALALVLSVLLLGTLYKLDWVQDRPSLWLQNFYSDTVAGKYLDAYSVTRAQEADVPWLQHLIHLTGYNLVDLLNTLLRFTFESLALHLSLWTPLVLVSLAWRHRRLRALALGTLLYQVVLILLLTLFYRWSTQIGLRQLLPLWPMSALLLAGLLHQADTQPSRRRAVVAALAALCLGVTSYGNYEVTILDAYQATLTRLFQQIPIPPHSTVILSPSMGPTFLYEKPGNTWALPPSNEPTMQLLKQKHGVDAIVMNEQEISYLLSERAVQIAGVAPVGNFNIGDTTGFLFLPPQDKP